ncbi:Inner membrane ABC transporter permease protein YtfT [Planctomycetes bacterium CA13]|uniref:Inner membrane ABC transporter permease protein YtfT n=1 Tax=Novipirellula herctigrandis TaxID=2527986 RepID=A0A5C5Z3R9_9BACT|nr:Inner membrane ABC transporter permease protein YtfT [Planctomycetes bacterium CA13]
MTIDPPNPIRRITTSPLFWPLLGLVLLLIFNAIFTPSFFNLEIRDGHLYGSMVDVLNRGSIGIIIAIGMTLVIATGGVDLSVGSIMAISGAVAALMLTESNVSLWGVIPCALLAATIAGLLNGLLVAVVGIQPVVATLILMVCGRGIARFLTGEKVIALVDDHFSAAFDYLGNGHFLGMPFPVTIFVLLVLATLVVVRKTVLGLFIESVGSNEVASRAVGIQARTIKIGVYAFCGFCAGIAGLIDASNINAADTVNAGVFTELDAIFAVVVGGTALTGGRFTLVGSVVGALLLQTLLTTLYTFGFASDTAPVPKAIVIVGVCLLQSDAFRQKFRRRSAA